MKDVNAARTGSEIGAAIGDGVQFSGRAARN